MRCSSSFIRTLDTPVDAGQLLVRVHAAVHGVGFPVGRQKRLLVRQHEATLLGGVTDLGLGDLLVASTIEQRISRKILSTLLPTCNISSTFQVVSR